MKFVFLIAIFVSFQVSAGILKRSEINGVLKVEIDLNKDKKVDRIDLYKDGQIFQSEEDDGFLGSFNKKTQYFRFKDSLEPTKIVEIDSNRDGKIDRVEKTYEKPDIDQSIVTYTVSTKDNGEFDKTWTLLSKLNQQKDICDQSLSVPANVSQLNNDVSKLGLGIVNGYLQTVPGYKVHTSCMDKWGHPDFINHLTAAMDKGKQCLADLGKRNSEKINGAALNLEKLKTLQEITPVTIACHQTKGYEWTGVAGHASTGPEREIESLGIKHPYISINPNDPKEKTPTDEAITDLKATLFHEQLHNLGIKHGEGIEFPYTCEKCCLTAKNQNEKDVSCRICQGDYSGPTDKRYLLDMMSWSEFSFDAERVRSAIVKYIKEKPDDRWGVLALAASNKGDPLSRVGYEMGQILASRLKDLTSEEKELLESANYYRSPVWGQEHAKLIAGAKVHLYLDKSPAQAIAHLNKNKEQLKTLFRNASKIGEEDRYYANGLLASMRETIFGIWMNGYPNNKSKASNDAYELARYIGFFDK